jgi:dienelactone hydrolase
MYLSPFSYLPPTARSQRPDFFLTGFSAGGHLAWQITVAHPDLLAGVGLAAANFWFRRLDSFSSSPSRGDLPIQEFQGDKDAYVTALNQQWDDASKLAREHEYNNLTHTMVPGAGHQAFAGEVLRFFGTKVQKERGSDATKDGS